MHVKNHMAVWFLWFLWFLWVGSSRNPLYKPLCAFLVFVDLVWFLCGSSCGFWSRVVFWLWSARPIVLMWFLWVGGLAIDANVDARPLALCGLLKRFANFPASCYVPFCRHWGRPLQNGENDHG